MSDRSTTAEVRAMRALPAEGDMIRPGWTKHIRSRHDQTIKGSEREISRVRPFAIMLLARICFVYSASPRYDGNGKVIGWARKFDGPYWYPNWEELSSEFGCSTRTLRDEATLLERMGLIRTEPIRERVARDGAKNVPEYVIPNVRNILKITDRPVAKDGSDEAEIADEETSDEPMKFLPLSRGRNFRPAGEETSVAAAEETSSFPHIHSEASSPKAAHPASGSDSELELDFESTNARGDFSAWIESAEANTLRRTFREEGMADAAKEREVLWRVFECQVPADVVLSRMTMLRSQFDEEPRLTYWPGWWIAAMQRDAGESAEMEYRAEHGLPIPARQAVTMPP
jgi:hypothetical protein